MSENIRDAAEWKAIEADLALTRSGIADAIFNAIARHKAECHAPDLSGQKERSDAWEAVFQRICDTGLNTHFSHLETGEEIALAVVDLAASTLNKAKSEGGGLGSVPPDMVLVRREDAEAAAKAFRRIDIERPWEKKWKESSARLEAAATLSRVADSHAKADDGWRERCPIAQDTCGRWLIDSPCRTKGWDGDAWRPLPAATRVYWKSESAARAALAKAPKPEGV